MMKPAQNPEQEMKRFPAIGDAELELHEGEGQLCLWDFRVGFGVEFVTWGFS